MTNQPESDENEQRDCQMRREADRRLAISDTIPEDLTGKSPEEIIQELRIHQIELEIQNEELQKSQHELESSREQYVNLYEFSPAGYITLTQNGTIAEVNLTCATMLGVVRQNLTHTRFRRFISPDDEDTWNRFFFLVLSQEQQQTCDIHLIRADGSSFFSRISGFGLKTGEGSLQIRLVVLNISVEHEAIQRSELNAQRILSLLGLYQHADLSDTAFMEYVLEESLKVVQSRFGFIGLISDDEQVMSVYAWSREAMASCAALKAPLQFPILTAGVWADSVRLKKPLIINDYEDERPGMKFLPEGHTPLFRMISVPVMKGEHVVAVIAGANKEQPYDEEDEKALTTLAHTAWELLNNRRTEEAIFINEKRLRKAQYSAEFGNLVYDNRSRSISISDEVYRIFGVDRLSWTGSIDDFFMYIHPDDRTLVHEALRIILENGGKGDLEYRVTRPDGTVRWVHTDTDTTIDMNGERVGIEGIIKDITDRKQSDEDRIKAFTQITRNLELMAILNDEIRNPLAIITAVCDLEEGQYTETILKAVTDIDEMVKNLDKGWLESEKIRTYLKLHYGF